MTWNVFRCFCVCAWWALIRPLGFTKTNDEVVEWFEARPWAIDGLWEIAKVRPNPSLLYVQQKLYERRLARLRGEIVLPARCRLTDERMV